MGSDLFEHVCLFRVRGIVDSRCFGLSESSRTTASPYLYLHKMLPFRTCAFVYVFHRYMLCRVRVRACRMFKYTLCVLRMCIQNKCIGRRDHSFVLRTRVYRVVISWLPMRRNACLISPSLHVTSRSMSRAVVVFHMPCHWSCNVQTHRPCYCTTSTAFIGRSFLGDGTKCFCFYDQAFDPCSCRQSADFVLSFVSRNAYSGVSPRQHTAPFKHSVLTAYLDSASFVSRVRGF